MSGRPRIFIAGHNGMVGSAIARRLAREDVDILRVSRAQLDLRDQTRVHGWIGEAKPDAIILAAAKVGGILANSSLPAEFLYDNVIIEANIINAAHKAGVDRLVFLGSSCIYPKFAPQPIAEEALLSGELEPTNEWYAIAKIAGIKLCQAYRRQHGRHYISIMPCNLYGPGDNFDLSSSHVIPALIRKCHEAKEQRAKEVVVWGSGTPRREFLHADDLADAVVFLLAHYDDELAINCGAGVDLTIRELAETVARVVGFDGALRFDATKPDGTPRKLMDSGRLSALGWSPQISLENGIADAYRWFLLSQEKIAQSA